MAFLGECFNGVGYLYTSIKSRTRFRNKTFWDEILLKNYFFCIYLAMNA